MKMARYIFLCLFMSVLVYMGCQKQDTTYRQFLEDGEIIYVGKVDSIKVFPGKDRLKLQWLLMADPNITKIKILWDNGASSLEIPVSRTTSVDMLETIIPDLDEGIHVFEIYTYDRDGNSSIKVSVDGMVYGDTYIASLLNRSIQKGVFEDGKVHIIYHPADGDMVGTEVEYVNEDEETKVIMLPPDKDTLTVPDDFKWGTLMRYRTLYLPDTLSIDTFHTLDYVTVDPGIWYVEEGDRELDKSLFAPYPLPGDAAPAAFENNKLSNLWSGVFVGNQAVGAWYRTVDGSGMPHHFNFDLGVVAKLTSLRVWQRGAFDQASLVYANANLKKWEIWGSNAPATDGSYTGWELLRSCESFKPSGLPVGQRSAEDIAYAQEGELFDFPESVPAVRYIRVKVLETWGNTTAMFSSEFTFRASRVN